MKGIFAFYAVLAVMVFVSFGFMTNAVNQDSFLTTAAQDGAAEINLANLALSKSQNQNIKTFAQTIVDDHTKANEELKTLVASKNVTLPGDATAQQKATIDRLSKLSGDAFDREFIKVMVKDHEKAVKLFRTEANSGQDADVKAFAAKTLPILQSHLEMARSMSKENQPANSNTNNINSNLNMDRNTNSNSNMNFNRNMNSNSNITGVR